MSFVDKAHALSDAQKILGVGNNASHAELREAWRKLVFEMHPDRAQGTNVDFANVNAAYRLLQSRSKKRSSEIYPRTQSRDPNQRFSRPKRPAMQEKRVNLSDAQAAICARQFENSDNRTTEQRHIPVAINRRGRNIDYIVATPLGIGTNRIAFPIINSVDPSKCAPQMITFNSKIEGPGIFTLPEGIRSQLFTDANNVRIIFGSD